MAKREYVEANKRWLEEKAKEEGVKALDSCYAADARRRPMGAIHPCRDGIWQVLTARHPWWFYLDI